MALPQKINQIKDEDFVPIFEGFEVSGPTLTDLITEVGRMRGVRRRAAAPAAAAATAVPLGASAPPPPPLRPYARL